MPNIHIAAPERNTCLQILATRRLGDVLARYRRNWITRRSDIHTTIAGTLTATSIVEAGQ